MAAKLTVVETQIAILVGRGHTAKEVGDTLGLKEQSVRDRLRRARGNAGARTSAQLAVMVALARERQLRAKAETLRSEPVTHMINGEEVRMAPNCSMGAEMLARAEIRGPKQ